MEYCECVGVCVCIERLSGLCLWLIVKPQNVNSQQKLPKINGKKKSVQKADFSLPVTRRSIKATTNGYERRRKANLVTTISASY